MYLRLLYRDDKRSFKKQLELDKFVTIHNRKLQMLATEMFKVYRNKSPAIFREIFHRHNLNYNLRINSEYAVPNVRSVFHSSKSISYLGLKIWDIVPLVLKELTSIDVFKKRIKAWKSKSCPCRLM